MIGLQKNRSFPRGSHHRSAAMTNSYDMIFAKGNKFRPRADNTASLQSRGTHVLLKQRNSNAKARRAFSAAPPQPEDFEPQRRGDAEKKKMEERMD
jgi:hypothetical protein